MSQRLFSTVKVGLFCDQILHSTEKRRDQVVKIVTLTLRVQPFGADLARSLDDGVGAESGVRTSLFKLNHPEPKAYLRRVDFALGCPRQQLHVFAAPDTNEASILFDQVKIGGTYARTEKSVNGFGFVLKASFGPVGRRELEYIQDWHLTQRFVTFQEAEPSLGFEAVDDDGDDEDVTDADEKAKLPAPMFDDARDTPRAAAADREPARRMPRRHTDPKKAAKAKQKHGRGKRR